ncbi:MAG: POTRA domain-containing protein [Nitratireductor sp.]
MRREFDISEGDALNQVMIQKTKRRLEALGFFERVDISTRPGDLPDRVIVVARVEDKATGEFSIGGGYSTASGALGEISFSGEKLPRSRPVSQDCGQLWYVRSVITR